MSGDDDNTNVGNAGPTSASAVQSIQSPGQTEGEGAWNPAHRPDSDSRNARTVSNLPGSEVFDRDPQPTSEKSQQVEHEQMEGNELEGEDSLSKRHSISVHTEIAQTFDSVEPGSHSPRIIADAEGPVSRRESVQHVHDAGNDSDEPLTAIDQMVADTPIFKSGETAWEQDEELEHRMPMPPYEHNLIGTPGADTPIVTDIHFEQELGKLPLRHPPEQQYEHQGEVTEMEEAVDEAPNAPLLDDPESQPTVEEVPQVKRHPTMEPVLENEILEDFDGAPAPAQPLPKARPHVGTIDRSFTTNFTELPTPIAREASITGVPESATQVDAGWPAAGDDKTFGELLDDDQSGTVHEKQLPEIPQQEEILSQPIDDDWGASTNDDAFGFLGETEQTQQEPEQRSRGHARKETWGGAATDDAFGDLIGAPRPTESSAAIPTAAAEAPSIGATANASADKTEDDLAAMFAAALDDDDLLDEQKDLDPSAFFGDDDPGFLDDELLSDPVHSAVPVPSARPIAPAQSQKSASYVPVSAQQQAPATPANPYAAAPFPLSQSHGRSAGTPSTGLYDVYNQGAPIQQQQPSQRPSTQSAQSFADKNKGGYQSPYDLPVDVVKQPRQRPRQSTPVSSQPVPTPPPRSSSMSSQQGPPLAGPQGSVPTLPLSSGSVPVVPPSAFSGGQTPAKQTPKVDSASGFFAELPMAPKPRARTSGVYTPQPNAAPTPPPPQQIPRGPMQPPQRPQAPPTPAQQPSYGGLTQPERMPLLPDQPNGPTPIHTPAAPVSNQRYSPSSLPAPAQNQNRFSPAPPSQGPSAMGSRYSPAPAAQVSAKKYNATPTTAPTSHPGIQNAHAFAPRTSSPLAFHEKPHPAQSNELQRGPPSMPSSPAKVNGGRASPAIMSPDRSASLNYSPVQSREPSMSNLASPPQRPKTQSPPVPMKTSRYAVQAPTARPSSAGMNYNAVPQTAAAAPSGQRPAFLPHRRQFSKELNFAAPSSEHAQDPLQRWKGQPIFRWGDSGAVISSFPKQTPFYAAGHGLPSIKCTAGSVKVEQATTFMALDEVNAKFPGPLPSKSKKKKDVLAWMSTKIDDLQRQAEVVRMDFQIEPDFKKRTEEKLVLWRIMKIFVEHDGKLEADKKIEDELRAVLLPNLAQMSQVMELQSPVSTPPGGGASLNPDPVDKSVVVQLRQALLEGQRERAVWLAEEKKLWGHAMLIASTMGADTWRQIIQSFVRSQVKTVGSDARSLAALYQVFAGNAEECVDELVPPSARAGFQMMSKTPGAIAANPLEGLDQWQETLGLIAGNRTPTDGTSLLSLGKLLAGYGRAEAAHSCFLFARQLAKHTGADDADATFVLLGSNTQDLGKDLDAILLTEIYEWASSFGMQRAEYTPHLQSWKLVHAQELAAHGLKSKASAYCDHIATAYQSTTKPSQYYHPTFTQTVADLSAFLSQTPQTDGKSILSKGAMNKVSSGAASWFTKFVSGDDDQTSNASGVGPGSDTFGMVNGESPDISRTASGDGLYNAMSGGASYGQSATAQQQFAPTSAPSKYAPSGSGSKYAPMGAGSFGMPAGEPQRSVPERRYAPASSPQPSLSGGRSAARPDTSRSTSDFGGPYGTDSRRGSAQFSAGSYEPRPLLADQQNPYTYHSGVPVQPEASAPAVSSRPGSGYSGSNGGPVEEPTGTPSDTEGASYAPPQMGGYEPPSLGGGYEPPSYQPYEPEAEVEAEDSPKPKKKSFMDDDDDDEILSRAQAVKATAPVASSSAAPGSLSKSEADRLADEAFRKAAEADAERDKSRHAGAKKGSWLGGWFSGGGGGKKEQGLQQTQHSGPIKAKLGEENSFYYDKDLGKWVNKKDPQSAQTAAAATPPPPMGPSRAASGAMGPPSGPPSRVTSGMGLAGAALPPHRGPPSIGSASSPHVGTASGPPSRIGTPAAAGGGGSDSMGMAMNPAIAALNGGSGGGSGPPIKPPSRPATSMSNASSLDDLLGEVGPRKAGTLGRSSKKKGGRYVDVMAGK